MDNYSYDYADAKAQYIRFWSNQSEKNTKNDTGTKKNKKAESTIVEILLFLPAN